MICRRHTTLIKIAFLTVLICTSIAEADPAQPSNIKDPFPNYAVIEPNIEFWKKIFTRYSSREGVIHDKIHLNIIYDVIPLVEGSRPGADKINRKRIKAARNKYNSILKNLAAGNTPVSKEEMRIKAIFSQDGTKALLRKAAYNVRCQVGTKDNFLKGLIRSGAYVQKMRAIFKSYHLPEDLCYLPHVESSFNLKAYSKFGAAGVWQFTRSTGRRFLKIDYAVDERRDPILATHAAAKFLKDNYAKLGSWPLALTAYNHGVSGMMRAKSRKGSYKSIFKHYRGRSFKFASRNFYSEFLAAREIAKNYVQYFGHINLDQPAITKEVVLPGFLPLDQLTALLNTSPDIIKKHNPALRPSIFNGQKYIPKNFRLKLPARQGKHLASLIQTSSPSKLFEPSQKPSLFHLVRRGETAGKIAQLHGVKLSDLILANNLNSRATIYPNQNLQIPTRTQRKQFAQKRNTVQPSAQNSPPPLKKPEKIETPSELQVASKALSTPPEEGGIQEETSITQNNIPPSAMIARAVAPSSTEEQAEQSEENELALLQQAARSYQSAYPNETTQEAPDNVASEVNPEVVIGNLTVLETYTKGNKQYGVIQVMVEETLGHYADWLKVKTQSLRRLNNLKFGQPIHIDQKIQIPLNRVSKLEFEEKRYENQKENEEDFFVTYKVEKVDLYRVKPGDNLWTLCHEVFEIPLWLVKKYNSELDFSSIRPSQKLKIPVVEKIG